MNRIGTGDDDGRSISPARIVDIPFEFVGEVACAGALAEASHIESRSPSSRRHVEDSGWKTSGNAVDRSWNGGIPAELRLSKLQFVDWNGRTRL